MTAPMPDYSKLTDSEINRLCAERCGMTIDEWMESDRPEMMLRYTARRPDTITPFINGLREYHGNRWIGYQRLLRETTPRQHCEAFLKATEGVK